MVCYNCKKVGHPARLCMSPAANWVEDENGAWADELYAEAMNQREFMGMLEDEKRTGDEGGWQRAKKTSRIRDTMPKRKEI